MMMCRRVTTRYSGSWRRFTEDMTSKLKPEGQMGDRQIRWACRVFPAQEMTHAKARRSERARSVQVKARLVWTGAELEGQWWGGAVTLSG